MMIATLLFPKWCIEPDASGEQVCARTDRAVGLSVDGRIAYVGPAADAPEARHRVDLRGFTLMPGLINAHTHAAMTLMRGVADDTPLDVWLKNHIWPREGKHLSDPFVYEGTLLAAWEMLRGGTTCCNDMYLFPDAAARALRRAGMRAMIAMPVFDFPTPYAADADGYLSAGLAARDAHADTRTLRFALAAHAPYTVSDSSFAKIKMFADELNLPIHTHLQETAKEVAESVAQYGVSPTQRLADLDITRPDFVAIHAVHCDKLDIATLVAHHSHVVHCPTSNMKLASGVAPIAEMWAAGLNVALGTDGAASNNRLDMWQEMRMAALLAKVSTGDAAALPAPQVLHMATLGGARALGWADEIGSIEVGKSADLIAVDMRQLEHAPIFDPLSHLVYVTDRNCVQHVWVQGEQVVRDGVPTKLDATELRSYAAAWQDTLK
jgi:5-methylthioadenosine/S-adenosylhomocysteine deaminase